MSVQDTKISSSTYPFDGDDIDESIINDATIQYSAITSTTFPCNESIFLYFVLLLLCCHICFQILM